MRRDVICAILGFLVGAAALARSQDDDDLRKRLQELQTAVAEALKDQTVDWLEEEGPGFQLGVVPVGDLVMPLREHLPPARRMNHDDEEEWPLFGNPAEEAPQPFGTIEELLELVRSQVWPESWDRRGVSIAAQGKNLIVHNLAAVQKDMTRFLDQKLRTRVYRTVCVEAEVHDVSPALYQRLAAGNAPALSTEQRTLLDQELRDGTAKTVWAGRVAGFARQRVLLWHGEQIAVGQDPDVEVAEEASTSDVNIDVVQAGAAISVRPDLGDPERVRLELDLRYDELDGPVDQRETRQNFLVDMPKLSRLGGRMSVGVPPRQWALVGVGTTDKHRRVMLVRATVTARGGGR